MNLCSKSEIRRCRPLLGTFVEITAHGSAESRTQDAVNAAFAAIGQIHNLLSVHDPNSELSLLNREAATRTVRVSRDTFEVLRRADKLALESDGAFDYTVAPTLAHWGLLPANLKRENSGGWRDVLLLHGRKVRFLQPLALDLGGIAKGYAVDKAIDVLRERGIKEGVVNAGGDLRVFGSQPSTIHLRHPMQPQTFAHTIRLRREALSTSSPCFTERRWSSPDGPSPIRVSHLVNSVNGQAVTGAVSVTVRARECWLADALTKIVLNSPDKAERLLAKYNAEAFMLSA